MTHRVLNGVSQIATGTGTGALTLGSVVADIYQTLAAAGLTNGDTTYVRIQNEAVPEEWEIVLVTFTAPSTITPTFDDASDSPTDELIDFSAGNKIVTSTINAGQVVTIDNNRRLTMPLETALAKFGYVSVKDSAYGAVGDGTEDDTAAFLAARDTGQPVFVPPGTYRIEGSVATTVTGQGWIGIPGQSIVRPVGNFNAFTFGGGSDRCSIYGIHFDSSLQTGGYCVYVSNSHRFSFEKCTGSSPYNIFYAEQTNTCTLKDLWFNGARGDYLFRLFGSPSLRSDIVTFENVKASTDGAIAAASRAAGLVVDGNVHTVTTNGLYLITPLRGLQTLNTAGGTFPTQTPSFGRFHNFQVDFPSLEGFDLQVAWDYQFTIPYVANSLAEEGIVIGASCVQGAFFGGFVTGNAKDGIVCGGKDWNFNGTLVFANSFAAATLGTHDGVRCTSTAERVKFSGCHSGDREGVGATQRWGFLAEAGATNVAWHGGYLGGNLQGPWRDETGVGSNNFEATAQGSQIAVMNDILMGTAAGFGATAHPTINGSGVVTGITVDTGGNHYQAVPSVFIFDPTGAGSGFTGTAVVSATGVITGVTVNTGGSLYSSSSKIFFRPQAIEPTIRPYAVAAPNVNIHLAGKGTGATIMRSDNGILFVAADIGAASANYLQAIPGASGNSPALIAAGAGTNLDLLLRPKGTGALDLGGSIDGSAGALSGYLIVTIGGTPVKIPYYALS